MAGTGAVDAAVADATELMTPPEVCGDLLAPGEADGGVERDALLSLPLSLELPDAASKKALLISFWFSGTLFLVFLPNFS